MTRQPYFVNTTQKKIEVFGSFGGGMVPQAHPEKLKDDQSILIENADIKAGGVLESRGGYKETHTPSVAILGNTQGRFKYNNLAGGQDLVAVNGQLYTVSGNIYTKLTIENLASFQSVRPIEAVQVGNMMYIATGSGLVKYDGVTASLVLAYKPNGLEALYIGTNGYAANPEAYLSDTTGAADVVLGVVPETRYGVMNENVKFTAFIQTTNSAVLEYKWEMKTVTATTYTELLGWSTAKEATANFAAKGDYMIRVSMRKKDTTAVLSQYVLPRFKVNSTPDENPEPTIDFEDMKLCNRIFYHYERLWMYGDTGNPDHLYISHLNNFAYYPRSNIIRVTDNTRGGLNSVEQYKNFLICFTDGSIQSIQGDNPNNFQKQPIHMSLGTKYPYSTQIMRNYIVFIGNDNGVYMLKSFNYASDDKMNVERLDDKITDMITSDLSSSTRVLSAIYDDQYFLYIEGTQNRIYRFYYDVGAWVRDTTSLSFVSLFNYNNKLLLAQSTGGKLCELKNDAVVDGVNSKYVMKVASKDFNFNMPHHRKKLKQFQLLAALTNISTIDVDIYLDNNKLLPNPPFSVSGTTTLSFDTNISTYVKGQTYTITVSASSRAAWDGMNIKEGDYITNASNLNNVFLRIMYINGYTLTVSCEMSTTDSTPATWNGELVGRRVSATLLSDPLQNSDAQKLRIMGSGRFRYVKFEISCLVKEKVQLTGWGFVFKENTPK